ncbi:MAG: DUF1669 domain-containing protein [Cyanobacteria bacterium SIG28]|nr:DUF1669 domain-containing protein [Cyanobacteria bacterium SIG28]
MLKRNLSIAFIIILFILSSVFFSKKDNFDIVKEVRTPNHIIFRNSEIKFTDYDCFDTTFTKHNYDLAKKLNITETDAFLLGNIGKYWTESFMKGRVVRINKTSDLTYTQYSYLKKFLHSGFCIKNSKPYNQDSFNKRLKDIQNGKYRILDLETNIVYEPENPEIRSLKNFLVIKKRHLPKHVKENKKNKSITKTTKNTYETNKIKLILTDFTTVLKPNRSCKTNICKELVNNINETNSSIDIAIYGYSKIPAIENALKSAINRGVKIRLVYDINSNGQNIYPDTEILTKLIPNNINDEKSIDAQYIMHNKFYIFDNKKVLTGSANLSHTDMSGFNSNSFLVLDSTDIAKIYKNEFEQMYNGKFHTEKHTTSKNKKIKLNQIDIEILFSPQDRTIKNAILPLINKAEKYIYIPAFVLTEKQITESLIQAKKRGVDVKIIIDALNASSKYTKHNELRNNEIEVKTENYAGKMHSKSIIIDDKYTIVGSMNFSASGEYRNDENTVILHNSEITKFYKEFFEYQWNKIDNKWLKYNVRAESLDSIGSCYDGIDNNYDDLTDSEDKNCKTKIEQKF